MTSRVLRGFVGFLFLIAAFIGSAAPAFGVKRPLSYSVIPLGTPGTEEAWSPNFFYPEYINNKGDVVGSRGSGVVFYRDGAIHELGYPRVPLEPGWTSGLNDRGEILGCAFGESTGVFILPSRPRPLPVSDATLLPVPSFAPRAFNDYGTITGYIYDWRNDATPPAVYRDGRITELPSLVPGGYAETAAINNRGQIVGTAQLGLNIELPHEPIARAVIWSAGRIRNLGVLPGFYHSYGADINDRGEAVGTCMGDGSIGFIYRDGVMRPLPSLPGIRHTNPSRINNAGEVLAWVYPPGGDDEPAAQYGTCWLYANGEWHDLAPVVARATRWPVQVLHVFDINDHGAIIGVALYPHSKRPLISQGVLLVPQRHAHTESRLPSRGARIRVGR